MLERGYCQDGRSGIERGGTVSDNEIWFFFLIFELDMVGIQLALLNIAKELKR